MNKMILILLLLALLVSSSAHAQVAKETPLMVKDLPDVPGKEGLIETVFLTPGEVIPAHQHNADVFAYVPEGSIVTQLKSSNPETAHAGEVFCELPTDVYLASRNASTTSFWSFFVKNIGAPPTVAAGKADSTR